MAAKFPAVAVPFIKPSFDAFIAEESAKVLRRFGFKDGADATPTEKESFAKAKAVMVAHHIQFIKELNEKNFFNQSMLEAFEILPPSKKAEK